MYYFIVNPSSRSGKGQKVWQLVEAELERAAAEYRVFFTSHENHATELAKEISCKEGRHTIVALGGDGTVNEIINGIQDFDKITFAYIPTGSSNDFARSLKLPTDPVDAVKNIMHPTYYTKIDLGQLEYEDQLRLFAVSCGIGFDAAVCHEALVSKLKKVLNRLGLGKLTYVGIALHQIFTLPAYPITITMGHKRKTTLPKAFFVAVMNCPYEGGGLKMCPKASPSDGHLDVCAVRHLNKLLLTLILPTAYSGKHVLFRKWVHIEEGNAIHIQTPYPLPVHADGEACGCQTSFTARCLPQKLKLITGK